MAHYSVFTAGRKSKDRETKILVKSWGGEREVFLKTLYLLFNTTEVPVFKVFTRNSLVAAAEC